MTASQQTLIRAYRHLLRAGLRAVQYSSPARYSIRAKLRQAFRVPLCCLDGSRSFNSPSSPSSRVPKVFPYAFSQKRVANTIEFLNSAAKHVGTEHHIVKNLCHVEYRRTAKRYARAGSGMKADDWEALNVVFDEFDETVRMLNETLELELR